MFLWISIFLLCFLLWSHCIICNDLIIHLSFLIMFQNCNLYVYQHGSMYPCFCVLFCSVLSWLLCQGLIWRMLEKEAMPFWKIPCHFKYNPALLNFHNYVDRNLLKIKYLCTLPVIFWLHEIHTEFDWVQAGNWDHLTGLIIKVDRCIPVWHMKSALWQGHDTCAWSYENTNSLRL